MCSARLPFQGALGGTVAELGAGSRAPRRSSKAGEGVLLPCAALAAGRAAGPASPCARQDLSSLSDLLWLFSAASQSSFDMFKT